MGRPLCLKQGTKAKPPALGPCLGNRGDGEGVVRGEGRVTEGLAGSRRAISFHSKQDGSHCRVWAEGRDQTSFKWGVILVHMLKDLSQGERPVRRLSLSARPAVTAE